ncbi:MAG: hypothetical protein PVF40_08595, partial [Ectothiorhodospiraceae bacterium]
MTHKNTLPAPLRNALPAVPEKLRDSVVTALERLPPDPGLPEDEDLLGSLARVFACSEFVGHACVRQPGLLADLADSGDLRNSYGDDG